MRVGQLLSSYINELYTGKRILKGIHPKDKPTISAFVNIARGQGVIFATELQDTKIPMEKFKQYDATIFRPPYPVTILEYDVALKSNLPSHKFSAPYRIIVAVDGGDHVLLYSLLFAETINKWRDPTFELKILYNQDGKMAYEIRPFLREQFNANYKYYTQQMGYTAEQFNAMIDGDIFEDLCGYAVFCSLLHDNHVTFEDVVPDAKLNKMRRARGKAPLFTYKTLVIGKKKRKSQHLGGTHASPRSHLRRGYYRTSRNGVRHWVQPCMVKGETDGFVHKDYIVEGAVDGYPS
jgi:hypothetical protein